MYDIAIIGAGIVGAMIARELSKYDLSVCVVEMESDVAMGSTRANSAIIHSGYDATEGSLKARLNVRGSEMMSQVAKELGVRYIRNGSLVIGFNDNDCEEIKRLYHRGISNGVKNLSILNQDELRKLEPNISKKAICALYAPTGAIICPYELATAAIGNAMDNGVDLKLNFKVERINKCTDIYEIMSSEDCVKAKYIINAAGLFADEIAKMIGDTSFNIHPRKGEYLLLDKECGSLVSHTIFRTPTKMGKGILVSPTVDGNLILGPTSVDRTDKVDTSTTMEGVERIISEAKDNVENIQFNKVITSFAGLRATGNTGDFIINYANDNFINVAGIESPGLTAAPAIAEYVVELLKKTDIKIEKKENFNPYRKSSHFFKDLSDDEKNKLIKENSKYGKIICRCEMVSEGEIVDAINTNPKATNVDAVKRRTRSGMGRCQGGFCSPHILDILARELNIPAENVTKSGGASNIIICKTEGGEKI